MPTQKQQLRAKAHQLNPVVIIGNQGLTANVHQEIDNALLTHELIKIRVHSKDREHIKKIIEEVCQQHQAQLIQTIGHIFVIYRKKETE